jgi:hypothetical protein
MTKATHINTHTLQNPHIHTPTYNKTHTYTHPHVTKPTHTHTTYYITHTYTHPHMTKATHTNTHILQNPHIHTPTHYKTHTYTHPLGLLPVISPSHRSLLTNKHNRQQPVTAAEFEPTIPAMERLQNVAVDLGWPT